MINQCIHHHDNNHNRYHSRNIIGLRIEIGHMKAKVTNKLNSVIDNSLRISHTIRVVRVALLTILKLFLKKRLMHTEEL